MKVSTQFYLYGLLYCFAGYMLMPPGLWYLEFFSGCLFMICGHYWTGYKLAKVEENTQDEDEIVD